MRRSHGKTGRKSYVKMPRSRIMGGFPMIGGRAWTPEDNIGDVGLWYNETSDILTDTNLVELLGDKSGGGHDMIGTGAERPSVVDWSGRRGVFFDAGELLRSSTGPTSNDGGPMAVMAAVHSNNTDNAGVARAICWFGGGTGSLVMRINTSGTTRAEGYRGTTLGVGPDLTKDANIVSLRANSTNFAVGVDNVYGSNSTVGTLGTWTAWVLGANNGNNINLRGTLGEFVLFNSDNTELLNNCHGYLSARWDLTV